MQPAIVRHLRCPVCAGALTRQAGVLGCAGGHRFDLARQGYVNLLTGHTPPGTADTADMVAARDRFLAAGHYRALESALAAHAVECLSGGRDDPLVVDVGAGTGTYLRAVLDACPSAWGLGIDAAKHAARRAARAHPRAGALVADVWQALPVATGAAALVLDVLAPRNPAEFRRIIEPEGALLVVTPTPVHLREVIEPLGLLSVDARKDERLAEALGPHFVPPERREVVSVPMALSHDDVGTLARMGPSARHLGSDELDARVAALPEPVGVTASFALSRHRPRRGG